MDSQYYDSVNLSCNYCGMKRSKGRIKACQCQMRFYCSASSCQKEDWDEHKAHCTPYVERDPCWVKWFPARRVFWQAIMGGEFASELTHMMTALIIMSSCPSGSGLILRGYNEREWCGDCWRRDRRTKPSSNPSRYMVESDSSVRLAIVMSFKTVRILPFRVGNGEGALDKKYTLASFLEHVNSGIKVAVVRKFRDERNGLDWRPHVAHITPSLS
ncbi:hypothetical protein B0H14DRAFT_3144198 [Mycena olivaceomarginata]|nr:hypothetical protein B0H14DRAFT_3144198 [Mycena olivaceomarginata]